MVPSNTGNKTGSRIFLSGDSSPRTTDEWGVSVLYTVAFAALMAWAVGVIPILFMDLVGRPLLAALGESDNVNFGNGVIS